MYKTIVALCIGGSLGTVLRWFLGARLNSLFPMLPPGTLAVNLIGGYLIGLLIAFFASTPNIAPEWRLFLVTGFCGGLTTFSSFSIEVTSLLQQGRLNWALAMVAIHVMGSVLMTFAGIATVSFIKNI